MKLEWSAVFRLWRKTWGGWGGTSECREARYLSDSVRQNMRVMCSEGWVMRRWRYPPPPPLFLTSTPLQSNNQTDASVLQHLVVKLWLVKHTQVRGRLSLWWYLSVSVVHTHTHTQHCQHGSKQHNAMLIQTGHFFIFLFNFLSMMFLCVSSDGPACFAAANSSFIRARSARVAKTTMASPPSGWSTVAEQVCC